MTDNLENKIDLESVVEKSASTEVAQQKIQALTQQKTLLLATKDERGLSCISYAPFVKVDSQFYIFISGLASHTKHLNCCSHCQVMLIQDEAQARNLFARNRLTYETTASLVDKSDKRYEEILNQLQARCGATVAVLRTLPDFALFCLTPSSASLVIGFGKAYRFNAQTPHELTQITDKNIDLVE